jgi:hypothetical protein
MQRIIDYQEQTSQGTIHCVTLLIVQRMGMCANQITTKWHTSSTPI